METSSADRRSFERNGYLVIPGALNPIHLGSLKAAVQAELRGKERVPYNEGDILGRDPAFLDLIDCPEILPRVTSILGWNIWVNHTHLNVNFPETPDDTRPVYYGWHRDGGAVHRDLGVPAPAMSVKVGFYLTDLTSEQSGRPLIVPGSHRPDFAEVPLGPHTPPPEAALSLPVKAGTAVLYHQRLLHAMHAPHRTDEPRLVVFVQWAYRWLQAVDPMTVNHLRERVMDPVRRQLLGFHAEETVSTRGPGRPYGADNRSVRYYPREADVPLRRRFSPQVPS